MGTALCEYCQAKFQQETVRRRFCSERGRSTARQAKRAERESRLRGLGKVLARVAGLAPENLA